MASKQQGIPCKKTEGNTQEKDKWEILGQQLYLA